MLSGIALAVADVPLALIEQEHLAPGRVERGGEAELQFLFRDAERLLPVWHEGRLQLGQPPRRQPGLGSPSDSRATAP